MYIYLCCVPFKSKTSNNIFMNGDICHLQNFYTVIWDFVRHKKHLKKDSADVINTIEGFHMYSFNKNIYITPKSIVLRIVS